jgi:hypothetical protein
MEINPRVLFERMFGGGATAEERRARMKEDRSVLDFVAEEVATLERGVGTNDRKRLGQYLENVREVERRIQLAEKQSQSAA